MPLENLEMLAFKALRAVNLHVSCTTLGIYTCRYRIMGYFRMSFYFRIIRKGGLLRKFNSSNNMKPIINSNRIREILCDGSQVWLSWHCIGISRFPANFQDPNGPLLNAVPPEVIKAANKIVKQASKKGGILNAQQRKYSVSHLQSNASSNSSVGVGISL